MKQIRHQTGQSSTEYLVVSLVTLMLLGVGSGEGGSVITFFLDAIRTGFERFSGFLSLPL
ncbi:MAG: hypothetical protein Q7V02_08385 [Methylophilus sp.]|nr:hypothetical protein [Methylophilus sp.]